ncbi:MAG: polysaccharide biosynthesis protein [Syntrophomonadaceae bacterium]|nr:polysaccharide biosynthesis protein [Syntrophomonadaceae bacterium]
MIKGKTILVTGGTGTVGQALVRKILKMEAGVVRVFSRDEHKQFLMQTDLAKDTDPDQIRFLLGDVRDQERLLRAMEGVDIVFHLAALKHVPACEYNPYEAVKTNVLGTQNVIDCAIKQNVCAVVYASTDKAASPTNTMGASKLLAERLISSANHWKGSHDLKLFSVRFGNILNSRGSVIPLFSRQIINGGPLTVTDGNMTRFFMDVNRAVDLILQSLTIAQGGETFVFKMPVMSIGDMARAVVDLSGKAVEISTIGLRPGEKMYEELMSEEESSRALETDDLFVILPFDSDINKVAGEYPGSKRAACGVFSSADEDILPLDQIKFMLVKSMGDEMLCPLINQE